MAVIASDCVAGFRVFRVFVRLFIHRQQKPNP